MASSIAARSIVTLVAAAMMGLVAVGHALAQYGPPSTFLGTVADEQGLIVEGSTIEAYVGRTLCSFPPGGPTDAKAFPYGEGEGRVLFYTVDVVSSEQRSGCGRDGAEVRIKVGDRFANETAHWRAGPVRLDLTFGNIQPAVQPTTTPVPSREAQTALPGSPATVAAPASGETPSLPTSATGRGGDGGTVPAGAPATQGAVTRPGSLGTTADSATFEEDGSFPVWGVLLVVFGGIALAGGAIGIVAAQRHRDDES